MSGVAVVVAVSRQIRLCPTGQVLGKKVMSLYIGSECGATCRDTKGCAGWTFENKEWIVNPQVREEEIKPGFKAARSWMLTHSSANQKV